MAGQIQSQNIVSAADFYAGTRRKPIRQSTMTSPAAGGQQTIQLDRAGFLQGVYLGISSVVVSSGGVTAPNPFGMASAIREVRLRPNAANDIYDVSGFGYKKLVDPFLGLAGWPTMGDTYNQGNSTVAAGTFKLDMYIPVAMNRRDPIGLFNLQNPTTTLTLTVWFEAPASMGTAIDSVTTTVTPYMDVLDLFSPHVLPPQQYLHQFKEDTTSWQAGDITYQPELGQKYLACNHVLLTTANVPSDLYTRFQSVINGTDRWRDQAQDLCDMEYHQNFGANRPVGLITDDFLASTELGTLSGLDRDVFDTEQTTAWKHIITSSIATNLLTVRRQLVALSQAG